MVRWLIDGIRGMLMGAAEVVPGVSGGTIALIVGLYQNLIDQAAHLFGATKYLIRGGEDGRGRWGSFGHQLRTARWGLLIPVGIGMLLAIALGSKFLEPAFEEYPTELRALFAGLVAAGIIVPVMMVINTEPGRWRVQDYIVALVAAAFTFLLTGLPPGNIENPGPIVILLSGALAVCALVLPGVSGSFVLLSLGLYETTLQAVNDRDIGYLSVLVLGCLLGLGSFVLLLQWLLTNRTRITLVVITGLMAGSLRALWPWQTEDRALLAPSGDVWLIVLLFLIGFGVILLMIFLEKKLRHRLTDEPDDEAAQVGGSGHSPNLG